MSLALLFKSRRGAKISEVGTDGEILSLELDATIRESHEYDSEVSMYPVEDGSTLNDNIKKLPEVLHMTGFVTNSPISSIQERAGRIVEKVGGLLKAKDVSRDTTEPSNNVEYTLDTLLKICGRQINGIDTEAVLVDIVTGLRVYKSMAMQSLRIPRDASTGEAIQFDAVFIHIKKVKSETALIPNAKATDKDAAQSTIAKSKQNTPEADTTTTTKAAEVSTSWAKSLFNKAVR